MKHLSLFSGIGGFDLSAEWMGWTNVAHCEIDPFCRRILKHYWPNAITYEDIRTTDFTVHRGNIDILSGGFPCQPYSTAGKRKGKADDRHLWPEMLRIIREVAPRWVVGENVRGLVSWNGGVVFEEVQADLEAAGYEVQPFLLPAAGVGAPHRRERVWFVAYAAGVRCKRDVPSGEAVQRTEQAFGKAGASRFKNTSSHSPGITERKPADKANAVTNCRKTWNEPGSSVGNKLSSYSGGVGFKRSKQDPGSEAGPAIIMSNIESRGGNAWENFPTQPPLCGGNDELPRELDGITFSKWRTESLKGYGNAVVPQVVYQIFKAIEQYETKR